MVVCIIKGGIMKRTLRIICLLFLIFSNCSCSPREESAISIGEIRITAKEFDNAFNRSAYREVPSKEARKDFLEIFINRKLILKQAEKQGLDKDPQFLESVQSFWAQSLLKLILDKKIEQITSDTSITDVEIKSYYQIHKDKFPDKQESEVYHRIKLLIFKEKQRKALQEWMDALKKNTKIKINYKLLDLE